MNQIENAELERVNAFLPAKLVKAAKEYAKANNTSLTELLRTALKKHMVALIKADKDLPESLR